MCLDNTHWSSGGSLQVRGASFLWERTLEFHGPSRAHEVELLAMQSQPLCRYALARARKVSPRARKVERVLDLVETIGGLLLPDFWKNTHR